MQHHTPQVLVHLVNSRERQHEDSSLARRRHLHSPSLSVYVLGKAAEYTSKKEWQSQLTGREMTYKKPDVSIEVLHFLICCYTSNCSYGSQV